MSDATYPGDEPERMLRLRAERDQKIEEAYRRGYGRQPQEEWIGRAGLAAFAVFVEAERGDPL